MRLSASMLCAVALGLTAIQPAYAASDEDIAALRQEMKALRGDYESKIQDLERRLQQAEQRTSAQPESVVTPPPPPSVPASPSAFNPAISVILNGSYALSKNDPAAATVAGFALGEEGGRADRGFSLGESEVAISANVDQEFFANLIVAIGGDGEIGVEEGYIQTTNLPWGFTAKAGRFFSGIGYLNEKHAHTWEFSDAPLPYRAMLENQYGDDGVELRWLAPTDFFLEFGAEWFRGDAFPAGGADDNGAGTVAAFVHAGDDIDDSSSFLAGLSYLRTNALDRDTGGDIFTGNDDLAIASLVYKWAPNGNPVQTNVTLTGEYFFGREDGSFNSVPVDYERSGFYVQGVYQFIPGWRIGVRYASLETDDVPVLLAGSVLDDFGHSPRAISALLEYRTSEFGRFRAQYTRDDAGLEPDDELVFTYTVSIGAHGAHSF